MININNKNILKANNIILIDYKHYYQENLNERNFYLEGSSPYLFEIGNNKFFDNSWGHLLESVSNFLISNKEKSINELLNIKLDWTKQPLFIKKRELAAHKGPLVNELYINTNHTSIHLCWILQDLLKEFNVKLGECKLIIKKQPRHEKSEVRNYFYNKNIEMLKTYLIEKQGYDNDHMNKIITLILDLDKIFNKEYRNYWSLLLLESKQKFALLKSRLLKFLKREYVYNKDVVNSAKMVLDLLTNFYAYIYK